MEPNDDQDTFEVKIEVKGLKNLERVLAHVKDLQWIVEKAGPLAGLLSAFIKPKPPTA